KYGTPKRFMSARRLDQPLKPPGRFRQAGISGALIPGAGLRGIRREAENAKIPEHNRVKGRAEQERSLRITGGPNAAQPQARRHDVAVLQVVLSALEQCGDLRTIDLLLQHRFALRDRFRLLLRLLLGLRLRLKSEFWFGPGPGVIELWTSGEDLRSCWPPRH